MNETILGIIIAILTLFVVFCWGIFVLLKVAQHFFELGRRSKEIEEKRKEEKPWDPKS